VRNHARLRQPLPCGEAKDRENLIMPMVSVVLTTYNRASLLCETIASILAQSFTDFELIIVDNMSEDATGDRVEGFHDPRIRYFRNPNDGIISVNRNFGIGKACGKYIAFCDDDDLWMKGKLEKQVRQMESSVNAGLCYTNGSSFCENVTIDERILKYRVNDNFFHALLRSNFVPTSSVLIRASVLPHTGLFNEDRNTVTVEDYEMWLRIAHKYQLVCVDEPLIQYRIHKEGNLGLRKRKFVLQIDLLRSIRSKCDLGFFNFYKVLLWQWLQYLYRSLRIVIAK